MHCGRNFGRHGSGPALPWLTATLWPLYLPLSVVPHIYMPFACETGRQKALHCFWAWACTGQKAEAVGSIKPLWCNA